MMMPGRKYSATGSYRYGFNGKENDNEVKGEGNQQDYGMRIYDPRLGRFLSVDPLTKDYPMLTPYQYASNTPIWCIDLDGGEGKTATDYFVDFINWLGDSENEWEDIGNGRGPIGEKFATFNRNINPLGIAGYNGYQMVTGKDLDTKQPAPGGRLGGFTNLGVNAIMYASGQKFFGMFRATPLLEVEMNATKRVLSTSVSSKSQVQQAAIQKTNDEKQKIIAWVKQQSSTGSPVKAPLKPVRVVNTTPQIGSEFGSASYSMSVNGRINLTNRAVTNGTFDFVVTNEGKLIVGTGHYNLSGGASSVKAAGQIQLYKGKIMNINNSSGHYQPSVEQARAYGDILKETGADVSEASLNIYSEAGKKVEKIKL